MKLILRPAMNSYGVQSGNFQSVVKFSRNNGGIDSFTCTCGFMNDTGLPCVHITAVAVDLDCDVLPLIDEIYSIKSLSEVWTIDDGIEMTQFDLTEDDTNTPIILPPRGRPRKTRLKSFLEHGSKTSSSSYSTDEPTNRCSLCRQIGHNKSTCRARIPSSSQQ